MCGSDLLVRGAWPSDDATDGLCTRDAGYWACNRVFGSTLQASDCYDGYWVPPVGAVGVDVGETIRRWVPAFCESHDPLEIVLSFR